MNELKELQAQMKTNIEELSILIKGEDGLEKEKLKSYQEALIDVNELINSKLEY